MRDNDLSTDSHTDGCRSVVETDSLGDKVFRLGMALTNIEISGETCVCSWDECVLDCDGDGGVEIDGVW